MRSGYPQFAMAATAVPLLSRVRRLLGKDDPRRRSLPVWMALATVLIAAVAVTSENRFRAQSDPDPVPPQPPVPPAAVQSVPATPRAPRAPVPNAEPAESIEPSAPRVFVAPAAASVGYGISARSGAGVAAPATSAAPGASATAPTPFAAVGAYHVAALAAPAQSATVAAANHREGYLAGLVDAGYTQISVDDRSEERRVGKECRSR